MYVINTDDARKRCILARDWQQLNTFIRYSTREGIWIDSIWFLYNHMMYSVIYCHGPFVDERKMIGKEIKEFSGTVEEDGGNILAIHPMNARAYAKRTHTR